jgi:hypothetical protein
MATWEGEVSPEEIRDLLAFSRHLPKHVAEELQEMQQGSEVDKAAETQTANHAHDDRNPEEADEGKVRAKPHKHDQ